MMTEVTPEVAEPHFIIGEHRNIKDLSAWMNEMFTWGYHFRSLEAYFSTGMISPAYVVVMEKSYYPGVPS